MFMHPKSSDGGGGGGGSGCGTITITIITATINPTVIPAESLLAVTMMQDKATLSGPHVVAVISCILHNHISLWPGDSWYGPTLCLVTDCPLLCAVLLWDARLWVTWDADRRLQLHMRHRLDHIRPAGPG